MHLDPTRQCGRTGVFIGLVGHDHRLAHPFGLHLRRDLRHGQHAVHGLSARHRHRVVIEDLVGDAGARRDRRADRQQAGMEISAVAQVGEDVAFRGEVLLPQPGDALAAHLAEGIGIPVHPHRHVMAADARHRARALRHAGGRVVRTARTEPGLALFDQRGAAGFAFLRVDHGQPGRDAGPQGFRQVRLFQACRDRAGDQRRGQLVARRQQPAAARRGPFPPAVLALVELAVDARAHIVAPVVELFLQRIFQDLALFLDDQDFLQPGGEFARVLRVQRPDAAHLQHADARLRAGRLVQPQVVERLAHVQIGLARGHDAEMRARRVQHHPIQLVGAHIGQRRIPFVVQQPRLLGQRRIRPADVQAARGQAVLRQHDPHAPGVHVDRRAGLHHVGHALHRHPQTGVAAHGPAVQAVVQVFLHI